MTKTLRPYQKDIIEQTIAASGNVLIQAPTGAGKTFIAEKIIDHHKNNDLKTLFLAPKINLLDQTANAFKNLNPQIIHGSNKEEIDKNAHSFVSTIQTMSRRSDFLEEMNFDYIVLDEMHYGSKGKMQEIIKSSHSGKIIGLSATPYDELGKLLTDDFDTIIDDYDTKYMVENKYLVPIKTYESFVANLDGVKTKAGDWDTQELDIRFNTPTIVNKVVASTKDIIKQREKTIVFSINISHAEALCKAYNKAKLKAGITHSQVPKKDQEQVMEDFKNGKIQVLVSVDQLTTGFDVPSTDTIVLARPTQSQNLYKQIIGRALRLSPETNKQEAMLLDCGGVVSRLGMPLEPIKEVQKKTIKEKKPYQCKKCKSVTPRVFLIKEDKTKPVTICPDCNDEKEFEPKFIYKCEACQRLYDFKTDNAYFSFENDNMSLNCSCGATTNLGSLNDEEISFKELDDETQRQMISDMLQNENASVDTLNRYSEHQTSIYKVYVARNKNTPKATLIKMAKKNLNPFISSSTNSILDTNLDIEDFCEIIDYKKDTAYLDDDKRWGSKDDYDGHKYLEMLITLLHSQLANEDLIKLILLNNIEILRAIIRQVSSTNAIALPRRHYNEIRKYDIKSKGKDVKKNVELLLDLASEIDELKKYVASNKSISLATLKKLLKEDDEKIQSALQNHPKFTPDMLQKPLNEMDYWTRINYSEQKGLDKEMQLLLAQSKEDDIKTNLLKKYKSKVVFEASIQSIPNKDENLEEVLHKDYLSKMFYSSHKEGFMLTVMGSNHCSSDVLKSLVDEKHSYIEETLRKIHDRRYLKRDFKAMLDVVFEENQQ